jgi:hypothetical protein
MRPRNSVMAANLGLARKLGLRPGMFMRGGRWGSNS